MSVFPHGEDPTVAVVPMGDASRAACDVVATAHRETFGASVRVADRAEPPADDPTDGAANVDRVASARPDDADLAIGVTDGSLADHETGLPGMFAMAYLGEQAGVISTARLLDGSEPTSAIERERLRKEARSVAGALFGLETHLDVEEGETDPCVMALGDTLRELDDRPEEFCEMCWQALTDDGSSPEPPGPPDWTVGVGGRPGVVGRAIRLPLRAIRVLWLLLLVGVLFAVSLVRLPFRRLANYSSRDLPKWVHSTYRHVRFWWNLVTYGLGFIIALGFVLDGAKWLFGWTPEGIGFYAAILVSLVLGYLLVSMVKGVVAGLYYATGPIRPEEPK